MDNRRRRSRRWQWLFYLALALALIAVMRSFEIQDRLRDALAWIGRLGPWGLAVLTGIYVVAALLFIPGSVLTLGMGAIYGVVRGSIYASLASTVAAAVAFLVSRYLARDLVVRRFGAHERFTAIDRAVAADGWKVVLLTRLSPMFPYSLTNYGFGLTRVKLSHYVVASWLGMMPATVMYVYLGSLAGAAAESRERTPAEWAVYGLGLLATIGVTIYVTQMARRALARTLPEPGAASSPAPRPNP